MSRIRIPLIVFGDGPRIPSGLARIARDLCARLVAEQEDLGIRVAQVGIDPPGGWQWQSWDFYGFQETPKGYGRRELAEVCAELEQAEGETPVVLAITDPARLFDITRESYTVSDVDHHDQPDPDAEPGMDLWGYLPIDAENAQGIIGGPAGYAITRMHRRLAYGPYGAGVLGRTLANTPGYTGSTAIQHLPHGLEPVFRPDAPIVEADGPFVAWADPDDALLVGCVATNQPRKDLGLLFASLAELKRRVGPWKRVQLWLHTDLLTKAWDIGQLAHDFCWDKRDVLVTATSRGDALQDSQLAARYAASTVTIAPGLGEGFGYPIVESLACGTPVVHGKYGGGVDLIPCPEWLVEPSAWRLESCYALQRPVFNPSEVADAVERAIYAARRPYTRAYCAGSVAHLHWSQMWPRWKSWVRQGLEVRRGTFIQEREVRT